LALIAAGEFEMGSHEDALTLLRRFPYASPDDIEGEWPVHRVRITTPFYMGAHEVTLGQFLKFYHAASYKCECERDGTGGWGWTGTAFEQQKKFVPWDWGFSIQTMDHPVVNVTWNDAVAFCAWLSKKENVTYRLPPEAEWESACRAGTKSRFWCGDDVEDLVRYANVADQTHKRIWGEAAERLKIAKTDTDNGKLTATEIPFPFFSGSDGFGFSAPVGSFKANAWGLYDMHGNVYEWCSDRYASDYYESSPVADPTGPSTGSYRVFRGGSWRFDPGRCRSANRDYFSPGDRGSNLGFRVALVPAE